MPPETASSQLAQRNFLRVSFDGSGKKRSPKQQDNVLDRDAEQGGRRVVGPAYSEVGSASKFATTPRDAFPQLLADLRDGTFGADVLGLWETSRGSRQMEQSLPLINALTDAGVLVWVHTRGRMFDPRNAHDRAELLSAAVKDELASAETSDRVLRTVGEEAALGQPHGMAPFGYRHEYDPDTGDLIGRVIFEPEAELVREVFRRTVGGETMKAIAADFEERGIARAPRTTKEGTKLPGGPYSAQHLGAWIRNPAYNAQRVHWRGRRGQRTLTASVTLYDAAWPAIVERDVWDDVQAMLKDPLRTKSRPGRARHLLGGIGRCLVCSSKLQAAKTRHGVPVYRCHAKGCVTISKADLDELALDLCAEYLGSREYAALAQPDQETTEELAKAERKLADASREIADLEAAVLLEPGVEGHVSVVFAAKVEPGLRKRQADAQKLVDKLRAPKVPAGVVEPGKDARARLLAAPFTAQRRTASALLDAPFLGVLRVARLEQPGFSQPAFERVHLCALAADDVCPGDCD